MPKKEVAVKKAAAAAAAAQASVNSSSEKDAPVATGKKPTKLRYRLNEVYSAFDSTYNNYIETLTPRLKLIDVFLAFLVLLGVLQFVYMLLVGNFPYNAFLGGFISCVGQFVLTVSLRLQYVPADLKQAKPFAISPERAFVDYVFASLILHFIVFHFIN